MDCTSTPAQAAAPPSDWVVRWTPLLPPGAQVLDVACGHGRHVHWLAGAGHRITAIDRDPALLTPLGRLATTVVADLEADPWPLPGQAFDAVVVTNYLWRALFPALKAAVAPGGLLIYETFAQAHAALGRPHRPEFLLRPGELIDVLRDRGAGHATDPSSPVSPSEPWHVIAFEQGRLPTRGNVPEREVQRIVARRGNAPPGHADLLAPPG